MAVLNFPNTPSNGDTYTENGIIYTYSGTHPNGFWKADNQNTIEDIFVNTGGDVVSGNLTYQPAAGGGNVLIKADNSGVLSAATNSDTINAPFVNKNGDTLVGDLAIGTKGTIEATTGNVVLGKAGTTTAGQIELFNASNARVVLNENDTNSAAVALTGGNLEVRGSTGAIRFMRGAADEASSVEVGRFDTNGIGINIVPQHPVDVQAPEPIVRLNNSNANGLSKILFSNTGFASGAVAYNKTADRVELFAGGDQLADRKVFVGANGNISIGATDAPARVSLTAGTDQIGWIDNLGAVGGGILSDATHNLRLSSGLPSAVALTLDSAQRALIGTASAPSGTNTSLSILSVNGNSSAATTGRFNLGYGAAATSLSAGNVVSYMSFGDTAAAEFAAVKVSAGGSTSGSSYPGRLALATTAVDAVNPTDRLIIDEAGKVGIGEASEGAQLHILSDAAGVSSDIILKNSNAGATGTKIESNKSIILNADGNIELQNNGAELARLTSDGKFGVGVDPSVPLHVSGDSGTVAIFDRGTTGTTALDVYYDGAAKAQLAATDAAFEVTAVGSTPIRFLTNGSLKAAIDADGRFLLGTQQAAIDASAVIRSSSLGATSPAEVYLEHGSSLPPAGTLLGRHMYADGDNNKGACVDAFTDGAWSAGNFPTRLEFGTTQATTNAPEARFRIKNDGTAAFYTGTTFKISSADNVDANDLVVVSKGASSLDTGTAQFKILVDGNVENINNSYGALSDIKLKKNIETAGSQWEDLKAIRLVNYDFRDPQKYSDVRQLGVIAQELEQVSPGLITTKEDYETVTTPVFDENGYPELDENGNQLMKTVTQKTGGTTKSVKYSIMFMKAVGALQEAMARIEQLEAEVRDLKS